MLSVAQTATYAAMQTPVRAPPTTRASAAAADMPALSDETLAALAVIEDRDTREHVHARWRMGVQVRHVWPRRTQ